MVVYEVMVVSERKSHFGSLKVEKNGVQEESDEGGRCRGKKEGRRRVVGGQGRMERKGQWREEGGRKRRQKGKEDKRN